MAFKSYSHNIKKKRYRVVFDKNWKQQQEPQDEVVPIAADAATNSQIIWCNLLYLKEIL